MHDNNMLRRTLASKLKELTGPFPVVFLTGPRQSGKTTLARACFPAFAYHTFEDLQSREFATVDPKGFMRRLEGSTGTVLDEVQYVPDLFSYIQLFADEHRGGPLVLTGSQQFLLSERISQSLAGRAAVLELLPFSLAELLEREPRRPEELFDRPEERTRPAADLDQLLFKGLFPPLHDRGLQPMDWYPAYARTYIERDVRQLTGIGDLQRFTRFVRLCAGRAGQLLNVAALGADAGVSHTTAQKWLSVLRASYVIELLPPHHENFRKRLVKSPKLHFLDTGLLCHLLDLRNESDLANHPLRGGIFESFAVAELRKVFLHHGQRPPLYHWRDRQGHEVDLLVDLGSTRLPVEIKSGETLHADLFKGLEYYASLAGLDGGTLVYGGRESIDRSQHRIRSFAQLS